MPVHSRAHYNLELPTTPSGNLQAKGFSSSLFHKGVAEASYETRPYYHLQKRSLKLQERDLRHYRAHNGPLKQTKQSGPISCHKGITEGNKQICFAHVNYQSTKRFIPVWYNKGITEASEVVCLKFRSCIDF